MTRTEPSRAPAFPAAAVARLAASFTACSASQLRVSFSGCRLKYTCPTEVGDEARTVA